MSNLQALREALAADESSREPRINLATALAAEGKYGESYATLHPTWRNLTAHDANTPKCLCKRCIDPEVGTMQHQGMRFVRGFGGAHEKVVWFWMPASLEAEQPTVQAAVGMRRVLQTSVTQYADPLGRADDMEEDE